MKNAKDFPIIHYFFLTDGASNYPKDQLDALHQEMKKEKDLWTNKVPCKPKLEITIITNRENIPSHDKMK